MQRKKKSLRQHEPRRLDPADITRIDAFTPWQIRCVKCSELACLTPQWGKMRGECKCIACGATYFVQFSSEHSRRFIDLPLWLKANFRRHAFWALNREHLDLLERVIGSTLRERPFILGERMPITTQMPFNLPSWMLSAKNRADLLKLIKRLRSTLP